ncbi:MAG: outer membrane protein TolC [Crocinitomicaceae bacterium]|jgi:outer membrane protein TolC
MIEMKQGKTTKLKLVTTNLLILFLVNSTQAQVWDLQQCIDTALVNNKKLKIGKNDILIGEQKNREARANLIPKVIVSAEYKYYTDLPYQLMPLSVFGGPEGQFKEAQFGVPHNINANIQLSVPLYNPQAYGAIKATQVAMDIKEIQYQKTEETIYLEVSSLYYNAQILNNQFNFIDSNITANRSLLKNIELLHQQLLVQHTDVDRVALQLEKLKSQSEIIKNKYEQVLNGLKFLMGISIQRQIDVDSNIEYESSNTYATVSGLDFLMAKSHSILLKSELTTLKRTRLPSVSLFGSYGTMGYGYDTKPDEFLNFYPVGLAGLQIKYPLFNGTVTQRKIDQKELEIMNSELQLALIDDQSEMLIENAQMNKKAMQLTVETNLLQIDLANSIYNNTELQRRNGTSSLSDVLMADLALREAQQNYLAAIVDYLKADLELKNVTGNTLK